MAGGNLGDLFISLGIKDEMSKTLQKIVKGMNGVDQATQDAKKRGEELVASLNQVNGSNFSKIFREANEYIEKNSKGIANIAKILKGSGRNDANILTGKFLGAGNLAKIASLFGTINSELQRMSKNEDDADRVKAWQNRISNALAYIKLLQDINIQEKKISNTKAENPNVDTKSLDNAKKSLNELRESIISLIHSGGVDDSNILSSLTKVLGMAKKDVQDIISTFKKDNPLSAFTGGAAKVEADIARVTEKLAKMRDLMSEGTQKGYSTSMLTGSISELDNILTRLNAAKLNPTMLTDAAQMRNLISDVLVEMTKATAATQAYGREKGKVIAQERTINEALKKYEDAQSAEYTRKQRQQSKYLDQLNKEGLALQKNAEIQQSLQNQKEKAEAKEYDRQKRQRDAAQAARERDLKGMSDYIKRYMTLVEERNKIAEKAGISPFFKNDKGLKNIKAEIDTMLARLWKVREDITLYQHAIGTGTKEGISFGQQGLKEANAEAEKLMGTITALQNVYDTLRASQANVKDLIGQTPQKQRQDDIQKRMSEYYSKLEKSSAKQEAQATRDAAKAKREDAAAEKQRQREIDISTQRINSLSDALNRLKSARFTAKMLGINTDEINQQIYKVIDSINLLETARKRLKGKDKDALGSIGQIGNGREVQLANRVAAEYEKSNREVQKGIELEQKRQQEIAKSAAKARNDLAAAFAGANAEAKKMQSIVGDIKSLFLQGGIVFGAQQFFNSIVQTGGEIVQQHVALRSILGDVQKADELFAQTQQLALQSPFKFGELNRDVKQLAAFGVEANDLYDTTKRLADIASGLGVDFGRLGLAFGQVKARSWLDGKELRQFAYAGLPLLQKITELYNSEGKNGRNNYTQADVKKMITARQVSFEDVQKVLWKMTDEGGQFYNMQFVLSETLLGRWNKLIDAWDIMLGKFAEGKNIVGGTFSFIINRVTDLVLALDKLSPALLSFGAVFAARKLGGMAYSKMGIGSLAKSYTQQMNAQLKSYAIEQQQLVVEGEITQKIAQQNVFKKAAILSEKQSLVASYNRAALEGKMSVLQMQRAVKEGLVSKEIISQLTLMGQITAKQEQIILNGGRMSAVWSMTTSKIGGFINAIGGWWGIGITAITSLLMGYNQWSSRVKEEEKTLIDGAKQKSKSYGDFLSGLGPKDASNLSSQVDSMKEILKSSDDYTDSIKQQVESAGSLSKQYDILKEKIEDAKKANDGLADKYGVITNNATSATGLVSDNLFDMIGADTPQWLQWLNGLTNDDIAKNVEQAQESLSKFQVMFDELDSSTKAKMEDFIRSLMENNEELANQIKGLPLTEQIRMLAAIGGDDWEKFVDKFANGSKETENWLKELAERAKDSSDDVSEIMYDDVPRGLESVRKQLGLSQDQFRTWAKRNPEIFASMMDKMAQKANITSKTILYYFHSAISKLMDMDFWPGDSGNGKQGKPSYNSGVNTPFSEIIRQRLHKNGTFTGNKKKGKFWTREVDNALRQVQDQSFETTGENIRKELKAARNELDTIVNGKVSKNSSEYKNAKHKYDLWKAIANAGYISDDLGKNKVTGNFGKGKNKNGREEDTELKRLQEHLSSLKSARQMYQKYKSIMPDEEAKKKTYNLFPEVTGLNLDDYQKAVHSLLEGFSINTTERKKFQTSIYREVAEWLFDEKDKKEYEKKAADFSESMNKLSERWDLYKSLLEKTGSKFFAESAWVDAFQMDDKVQSLMDEYYAHYHEVFNLQNSLGMTDGEAKAKLKLPNQYEEWKKITELLRGNYVKSLKDAADIIEKTEDYEDKILKIRQDYDKLISKTNDPGIKARYEIQRDKEIGQVKLDKFKNSSDYLNFYGAIVSLGMDKAQVIGTRIRQNINEALQNGAIDAREYAKEIKQLDEQLSKLTSPKKTFLNGGLKGMAEQKISDASEQMTIAASKIAEGKKVRELGLKMGDENFIKRGDNMIASGKAMMKAAEILFKDGTKAKESLDKFANVVSIIDQNVQGMSEAFNDIKETASLLGADTESDGWQDASAFFETFSGMSSSLSKVVTSAESGNVGGILAGVTGIFTSPIKAFAKAHDAKLDRQIKLAERQLNELKNLSSNINSVIEKALGGIYSYERSSDTANKLKDVKNDYKAWDAFSKTDIGKNFFGGHNFSNYSKETYDAVMKTETNPSAYADQLALLHAQEDELRKQRQAEDDKKKTDKDKLADYDQQIKEMELQIKTFAQDFLKDVYSIDMKSWASTLTDTIVSAWAKGEDAVDAYKKKVKEMVRDVVKNIVTQKIMEKALEKPLEWLTSVLDKKGQLDETDMDTFAKILNEVGEKVTPQITGLFDAMKNNGFDMREDGSSSATNSVKSITEETADLLCSYVNDIRLNVSVDRENIKLISDAVKSVPELNVIARSQLTAMNQLVSLAEYRNRMLDDMYSWMRSVTKETGARSLRIK
nr:MAG TPA: Tape measure domain protein [Caudoviricetes sp.]